MSTLLFHFARNLKISRFTIDVLMQRLDDLKPCRPAQYERLLAKTSEGVQDCDNLHKDLCDRFCRVQSFDAGAIASLTSAFEELHRRIAELVANCNIFDLSNSKPR